MIEQPIGSCNDIRLMAVDLIDDTAGVFIDRGGNRTPFNVCIICYWACKAGNANEE